MKLLREFVVRDVMGEIFLIPVGENHDSFNGVITTNEIGKFIFEHLENANNEEELVQLIENEYDAPKETIQKDLQNVLQLFRTHKIIE